MFVVIASFAQDDIFDTQTGVHEQKSGGPAHWICSFYDSIEVPYKVHTAATKANVFVRVSAGEETGTILDVPAIGSLDENFRTASLLLVSTIGDEYVLQDLVRTTGIRALDVQGYVRTNFFSKQPPQVDSIYTLFDIVKMTESEMRMIPVSIVDEFKNRICLVTKGSKGFSLYENGIETVFEAKKINVQNAIGAGDTFFAAFCSEYVKSNNSIAAANFAKSVVDSFLVKK